MLFRSIFIEKDVVYTYTNKVDNVEIVLDISTTLKNFFASKISNYFTLDLDKLEYIKNNLLVIYETKNIDLYVKQYLNSSNIGFSYSSKTIQERQDNLMKVANNYRLTKTNNLDSIVTYNKINGYGYEFAISLSIGII